MEYARDGAENMGCAWHFGGLLGDFWGTFGGLEEVWGRLWRAFGGVEVAAEVLDYYFCGFFGFFNCAVFVGFLVFS